MIRISRRFSSIARFGVFLVFISGMFSLSLAQDENPAKRRQKAVESAAARASATEEREVLDQLLQRAVEEYKSAAKLRRQALEAVRAAQAKLDAELEKETLDERNLDGFVLLVDEAQAAHSVRHRLASEKLNEVRQLFRRREVIQSRLTTIAATPPPKKETLTGTWSVEWQPTGQTGLFHLEQSGALVSGRFQLGSVSSGSLQGTFVNGRLYLQRIDRKDGRDAELEGLLNDTNDRIEGSWQMYELVQGGLPQGRWVATRVE